MAIPKISKQNICDALKYIDKHGVPFHNQSTKYELVTEGGKKYPPKYVIAVASHLATGEDISVEAFKAVEAKNYLQGQGYSVEERQVKYELTITADSIISTDERFNIDNLSLGDYYKPLDAYYKKADGTVIRRKYNKGERRNSNQTLPRIACQVFEKQIAAMSVEDKETFPVCRYTPSSDLICGVYSSVEEIRKARNKNSYEYLIHSYDNGRQFVIYSWNIFSTLLFDQECLKRFGNPGDQMILIYRDKDEKEEDASIAEAAQEELVQQFKGYMNPYSSMLIESKNIIFRGAPGTGKSYLAKEIATDIISNGYFDDYTLLTEEQKKQVEFVQFHPSYDYTDFVEGLRPKVNDDGTMGFELQDGVFKRFVDRAKKNYDDSKKSKETIAKELSVQELMDEFFSDIELGVDTFKTVSGSEFSITSVDDKHIYVSIPGNAIVNKICLNVDEIRKMLESDEKLEKIKDVTAFLGKKTTQQAYSYNLAIYKEIKARKGKIAKTTIKQEGLKKYIFIIDEINRGEISKIFGELFFAIDPGYRGRAGEVSTQYANLHSDPNEKFYIPENVYIIGTMNDIDRSVDSFDFAMRRRFRFVELKANDRLDMLAALENEELESEAIERMAALNREIANTEDLNENYQIGASYFLKLKTLTFDQLWTDYLHPLLQEYIQGMYDEEGIMNRFAKAYGYNKPADGDADETTQD